MPLLGQSSTPSFGFDFSGLNTDNEIAFGPVVMPEAGSLNSISVYMGGHTAAVTVQGCVWSSTGALLVAATGQSVAKGSGVAGGQVWTTFAAALVLTAGEILYIGWFRTESGDAEWSVLGSGTFKRATTATAAAMANPPTDCAGGGYLCGSVGAYINYTPTVPTQPVSPRRLRPALLSTLVEYRKVQF